MTAWKSTSGSSRRRREIVSAQVCDEWGGCKVLDLRDGGIEFREDKNAHWCDIKGEKEDFETLWCADPTPAPTFKPTPLVS